MVTGTPVQSEVSPGSVALFISIFVPQYIFNPHPLFVMCTILALFTQCETSALCCVYIHALYQQYT